MKGQDLPRVVGTRGRMSVRAAARFLGQLRMGSVKFSLNQPKMKVTAVEGHAALGGAGSTMGRLGQGALFPPPFAFGPHLGPALSWWRGCEMVKEVPSLSHPFRRGPMRRAATASSKRSFRRPAGLEAPFRGPTGMLTWPARLVPVTSGADSPENVCAHEWGRCARV